MSARRNRPVLYEVVRRGERQRQMSWFSRLLATLRGNAPDTSAPDGEDGEFGPVSSHETPSAPPEAQRSGPAGSRTVDAGATAEAPGPSYGRSAAPVPPSGNASPTAQAGRARSLPIRLEGRTLRIELGYPAGAAAVLAIVVLLLLGYQVGRRSAPAAVDSTEVSPAPERGGLSSDASAPQMARDGGTRGAEPQSVNLPERATPTPPPDEPLTPQVRSGVTTLPPGRYLVVQNLGVQRNRAQRIPDGERIVAHLAAQGLTAAIVREGRRPPLVVVTQPLAEMSKAAIETLKRRVRAAGRTFAGYDFKDCYEDSF